MIDRFQKRRLALCLCVTVLFVIATGGAACGQASDEAIGFVKNATGAVTLTRNGVTEPLRAGTPLREMDRIETGGDGSVGMTFRDDTRIALGPRSRVDLAHFIFKPAEKRYGLVLRLARGTLEYISGVTAKLAPEAISIETPTSTIGVRGTRFLARVEE